MDDRTRSRIQSTIGAHPIVIFMKGDRLAPLCGFSAAVVRVFDALEVPYETVDVLQDPALREGIKTFSNWPTIPQVYIGGKFIGGCDIVHEMYERGELEPLVKTATAS